MGFDDGAVMIKIGREEPVASMDSSGKIIWARHNEIQTVNVKSLGHDFDEARSRSRILLFVWTCASQMCGPAGSRVLAHVVLQLSLWSVRCARARSPSADGVTAASARLNVPAPQPFANSLASLQAWMTTTLCMLTP